jgi:hypothetical protein
VALMLWIYYSTQILFLGAEFTQVYAKAYGSKIEPAENAVPVTEEARAQQGLPRREQLELDTRQQERQAGGRANGTQAATVTQTHSNGSGSIRAKPAGAGAVAGFLVGLVLGRRQRTK